MHPNLEVVPKTKAVAEPVSKRVRQFLRAFIHRHCADPTFPSGTDYAKAVRILGLSQGYLSDLVHDKKSPSLNVVLSLREATGASFEEITGHRAPLKPHFPMGVLASSSAEIEEAIEEGTKHERPSGATRAAKRFKR